MFFCKSVYVVNGRDNLTGEIMKPVKVTLYLYMFVVKMHS